MATASLQGECVPPSPDNNVSACTGEVGCLHQPVCEVGCCQAGASPAMWFVSVHLDASQPSNSPQALVWLSFCVCAGQRLQPPAWRRARGAQSAHQWAGSLEQRCMCSSRWWVTGQGADVEAMCKGKACVVHGSQPPMMTNPDKAVWPKQAAGTKAPTATT